MMGESRLYTLDVFLLGNRLPKTYGKKKRSAVSRVMQIRGDQTLEVLHQAIFEAFDRYDEHLYEFRFGKGPLDRTGPIYGLPRVQWTKLDLLMLTPGRSFGYWFDSSATIGGTKSTF
jgi:hypothetical protein